MGIVRAIDADLCFLDDFQLRTLVFVDGKKVLWFFKKSNNSKTMDEKKTNQIKRQLEMRWYKRHAKNLVGNEDYAYMKTTRNADGEFKHIIVLGSAGSERIDVVLTRPKFSVAECEEIAEKLAEFFKPYFDKYKVRKIY